MFNLTVQHLGKHSRGTQQLTASGQARRVTEWRRERRWETVELKDRQRYRRAS